MPLTESIVEDAALTWFGELGYFCLGVQALTPTLSQGERASYGEVVRSRFARTLTRPLPKGEEKREALRQIRSKIPDDAREKALRKVLRLDFPSLLSANSKQSRTLATLVGTSLPKLLGGELSVTGFESKQNTL